VCLSAYVSDDIKQKAFESGMREYFTKPLTSTALQ
jgi:CheY-like chemotaxis protein